MIQIQKDSDYHKNVKVQIVCFQSIFLPIMHRQSILNVYRSLSMKIIEYDTFHQFFISKARICASRFKYKNIFIIIYAKHNKNYNRFFQVFTGKIFYVNSNFKLLSAEQATNTYIFMYE